MFIKETDGSGKKALAPEGIKSVQNRPETGFIQKRITIHNRTESLKPQCRWKGCRLDDIKLVSKRNKGIGNEEGRKQCMSGATGRADKSKNGKADGVTMKMYRSAVVGMLCKAPGMATGAGKGMYGSVLNEGIVNFLRNSIAIMAKNRYHKLVIMSVGESRHREMRQGRSLDGRFLPLKLSATEKMIP